MATVSPEKAELESTLRSCLNKSGIHLIDLPIDYSENESVLTDELRRKTCLI